MKEHFILTIKAEDKRGLLNLITGIIERRNTSIMSLSTAPTDVHDILLITVEVSLNEEDATVLALKIEKVVEVYKVSVSRYNTAVCLRVAYFKIAKAFFATNQALEIDEYNGKIIHWYDDAFLVVKYGSDSSINSLYNRLDGPHLIAFSQTGLLTDVFPSEEQQEERVISKDILPFNIQKAA